MKKNSLFTVSLLSAFISLSCYAHQDVVLSDKSLSDAQVSINGDTGKTQVEVINTNQDNISHIYYERFDVGDFGLSLKNNAEAKLIINEVLSNKGFSILRGELELQGKQATVVIANPNGIFCNDCSFSGTDDVKLITGSSTGKYSKTFTTANIISGITFNMQNKLDKNEHMHIHRNYKDISPGKINIISNKVFLDGGDLNSEYIRFDIGLSEFTLGAENNYNGIGRLTINKETGINSRYLIIKANNSGIENAGNINTLSLNHESYDLVNLGNIDINTDDNLYRTAYDDYKQSKIIVLTRYLGSNKSSFNIKNTYLFMQAKYMYLDKKINIDNSYLYANVGGISIGNVKLSAESKFHINSNKSISLRGKIRGYGHVKLQVNDDKVDIEGKKLLIGTEKAGLEVGTKYKLGTLTIIDYSKYK
ncbi:two-partner secretion domain-containing protein [Proteus mirabilis]|uniref:two-partner secretion domain-containing protein n=1 Tax=Proteus mirabilis TaxID=584 RepID=UPI0034D531FF